MNILLLGGKGMLGHALASTFSTENLTVWDKENLDITDTKICLEKIASVRPDVILNASGYTAVDQAEEEQETAFLVNAHGVENIAQAAKELNATIVHYSTDYVFDGKSEVGYDEDAVPGPAVNAYGASKLAGEDALKKISPSFYLIRTAWLYGSHGKNFVETMLDIASKKNELRVINDQFGSPTYTIDLAQATHQLLTQKYTPGTYHLVNQGVTTWYSFAKAIFEQAALDVEVVPIPSNEYPLPAQRPTFSVLRNTRGPHLRAWQAALDEYIKSR